jgi:predicted aspartyl protease
VLSVFETELDFPRRRMTLYAGRLCPSVAMPDWTGPFSMLEAQPQRRGRFVVPITLDGHAEAALIDTGTQVSVVTAKAALAAGIDSAALDGDQASLLTGSGPQPMAARLHRFHEMRVGGEVLRDPSLLVTDGEFGGIDVVLGMDYLAAHRVWLSAARRRVFIDRPGGG